MMIVSKFPPIKNKADLNYALHELKEALTEIVQLKTRIEEKEFYCNRIQEALEDAFTDKLPELE